MASRLAIYGKDARFVIVFKRDGIYNFLQYRNVISWFFHDNSIRTYKTLSSAKKKLSILMEKYKDVFSDGYVIFLHTGETISSSDVERYINSDRRVRHI